MEKISSKEEERDVLDRIEKLIQLVGGKESYIGKAFEGCIDIAKENIADDSWNSQMETINMMKYVQETHCNEIARLKDENQTLKETNQKLEEENGRFKDGWSKLEVDSAACTAVLNMLEDKIFTINKNILEQCDIITNASSDSAKCQDAQNNIIRSVKFKKHVESVMQTLTALNNF